MTTEIEARISKSISAHYGDQSGVATILFTPIHGVYLVTTNDGAMYTVGGMKQCGKCGKWKPHEAFSISNKANDGLQHKCKDCNHIYHAEHKTERNQYFAKYRKNHLEKRHMSNRAGSHNRRARLRSAGGSLMTSDLKAIRAAQTDKKGRLRCWYCGIRISDTPHIEHKIPLSRGGSNGPENICYSCSDCNLRKSTKTLAEFAGRLL